MKQKKEVISQAPSQSVNNNLSLPKGSPNKKRKESKLTNKHIQHEDNSEKEINNHHRVERPVIHIQLVVDRIIPSTHKEVRRRDCAVKVSRKHHCLVFW